MHVFARLLVGNKDKTSSRVLVRDVVYKRFVLEGFEGEKSGVLDRWSLMGGGRLREVVAHVDSTVFTFRKH